MVLVVIRQKAEHLVAEHDPRREDRLIPLGHRVDLPGPQYEMGKFRRADRLGDGIECAYRGHVVHRISYSAMAAPAEARSRYSDVSICGIPAASRRGMPP